MNHSPDYEQLELYILGELPPDEAARIEAKVNEDPDTQHRLQSAKHMLEALDHSLAEPKARPDLAEQIIARLPSELPRTSATRQTGRRWSNRRRLIRKADVIPITLERIRKMKRIAKFAVAATVLVAICIVTSWLTKNGGSTNIAFANVADALDNLRSATYDFSLETTDPIDEKKTQQSTIKGKFLAPSRERIELSIGSNKAQGKSIMIFDYRAGKSIILSPELKTAIVTDTSKIKRPAGASMNMFGLVRRLVREGSSGGGEKAESLGKKEIDGRVAVGFRTRDNMTDMTIWADPQTARPVRIDMEFSSGGHGVMSNFRYDMELDPSLFSLEPPPGYTVQTKNATMPVEDDLIDVLRIVAEHNQDTFPATVGVHDKEHMQAIQAAAKAEGEELAKSPEAKELMEKLKAEYGEDKAGFMKAWTKEWAKKILPLTLKRTEKYMLGMTFYMTLQPQNDPHYVGGGVKLGTPDCPILWYKPTGAEKYRVIYADLSVKEMTPDDVKKFPEATPK